MTMHCPKCGNNTTFSTVRSPSGKGDDSTCLACSFKAPTSRFQMPVTEVFGSGKTKPMPSPSLNPREYMVALADKLKRSDGRQMTQGECKNLELAESTIRVQEGESSASIPDEPPGDFDNFSRVQLVRRLEDATAKISHLAGKVTTMADGADTAWGIIANASNWMSGTDASSEWVKAAERWRDEFYHPMLDTLLRSKSAVEPESHECPPDCPQCADRPMDTPNESRPLMATNAGPDVVDSMHPMLVEWVPRADHQRLSDSVQEFLAFCRDSPHEKEIGELITKAFGRFPETPNTMEGWTPRWVAITLWGLLDDIDTASDMFKDNYEGLAKYVYKKQQLRHQVGTSDGYRVEFNGYSEPPRQVRRDYGPTFESELKSLRLVLASAAGYIEKGEVDTNYMGAIRDTICGYPEIVELMKPPSVPNCPPCPVQWTDLRDAALGGLISAEELFSMGFSRWNEEGDEAEGEDLFSGGTLWLMPVNWYDELPKDFPFVNIYGTEIRVNMGASKDSRMGYLAFGIVWFDKAKS